MDETPRPKLMLPGGPHDSTTVRETNERIDNAVFTLMGLIERVNDLSARVEQLAKQTDEVLQNHAHALRQLDRRNILRNLGL